MIELDYRGDVAILRMANGKANALNFEFLQALMTTLSELEQSLLVRAVVLTSNGSMFGAGVDLPALVAGGPEYVRKFVPLMELAFERLARFPKPLVAAVNGHAIAGGAITMFACDVRILAKGKARIGLSEVQVGVVFPAWALEIARFATPSRYFQTLILTGQTWLPEQALSRGLVDELVDPESLLDRACEAAKELSVISSKVFYESKMAVRGPLFEAASARTLQNQNQVIEHWCAAETLEKIDGFAKRSIKGQSTPN